MAYIQNNARLFGLDLSGVFEDVKTAWHGMARWQIVSWLRPQPPVRWRRSDGTVTLCQGGRQKPGASAAAMQAARFEALEVPEDLLLRRAVRMPALPPAALQGALALEVQNLSPFPLEDLLWTSAKTGEEGQDGAAQHGSLEVVLTSRARLQAYLAAQGHPGTAEAGLPPEIWIAMGHQPPAVLPGFGEGHRQRHERQGQRINGALLAAVVLLAVALLVTPTVQLRLRALDALAQYEALHKSVAPLVAQRESLVRNETLLQSLPVVVGQSASALQVMELLTKALPDDTFLQSFQILSPEGAGKLPKVVMVGQAANAAALMQQLGRQPGVRDVKAPNAAVKPLGASKESFTIELFVDLAAQTGDAVPASQPAAAASTPAAPAAVPAPVASAAASVPPSSTPRASPGSKP